MNTCPYCAESIQAEAIKCRYCGEYLDPREGTMYGLLWWGYEYRTQAEFLGWPLFHVAGGVNPRTSLPRVAKGIVAIGNFAIGLITIGGIAMGGFTIAGIGLGIIVVGGIAVGAFSFLWSCVWPAAGSWRIGDLIWQCIRQPGVICARNDAKFFLISSQSGKNSNSKMIFLQLFACKTFLGRGVILSLETGHITVIAQAGKN